MNPMAIPDDDGCDSSLNIFCEIIVSSIEALEISRTTGAESVVLQMFEEMSTGIHSELNRFELWILYEFLFD